MRMFSSLGPTAAGGPFFHPRFWLFGSIILPLAHAVTFNPVPPPNLDLSQLGQVALTGNFDAISLYSYQEQNQNGYSTNGSQSLITQLPNGNFAASASADADIKVMCPFVMKDGNLAGVVVGGNFTSLGGIEANGVAMFDPVTSTVTPLPGLSGQVSAMLCDQDTNTVYIGGDLKGANSTNAIAWVGMAGWANLPFAGFNGPVRSITKASNGNILFGGSFTGLGNTTTPTTQDKQVINLSSANVTGGFSTSRTGYSDPRNIVCKTQGISGPGNTWLMEDDSPGYWRAEMDFGYQPRKLRIWNTHQDGRGTRTFRFTALPINGIMNLTYNDPETGKERLCDARCPLSGDPSVRYQDFHFVNTVGMSAFQVDVSAWHGQGGGFNGIELFQDGTDFLIRAPWLGTNAFPQISSRTPSRI